MKDNILPEADHKTQLFLNIPWTDPDDTPSPTGRGFMMQEEVIKHAGRIKNYDWKVIVKPNVVVVRFIIITNFFFS